MIDYLILVGFILMAVLFMVIFSIIIEEAKLQKSPTLSIDVLQRLNRDDLVSVTLEKEDARKENIGVGWFITSINLRGINSKIYRDGSIRVDGTRSYLFLTRPVRKKYEEFLKNVERDIKAVMSSYGVKDYEETRAIHHLTFKSNGKSLYGFDMEENFVDNGFLVGRAKYVGFFNYYITYKKLE